MEITRGFFNIKRGALEAVRGVRGKANKARTAIAIPSVSFNLIPDKKTF